MNKKHKLFIEEYLTNGMNASAAYKTVYKCSDATAGTNGNKLLQNTEIKKAIEEAQKDTVNRLQITRDELIQDLIDIKNSQKEGFPPTAIKAIEVIAKMLGMNEPDKQQITISEQPLFGDDE